MTPTWVRACGTVPLRVNAVGSTFGPLYAPTKPTLVLPPPAASRRLSGVLVTLTSVPTCDQLALQPLLTCCQPVGHVQVSVQPSSAPGPVFTTSTVAT